MVDIDKTYIIDASVILAGLLIDESFHILVNRIFDLYQNNNIKLLAPTLLTFEVLNGIKSAFLRSRIPKSIIPELISAYKELGIKEIEVSENEVMKIAISYNLSVYDSAYVSLISLQNKPLITADRKLYDNIKKTIKPVIWVEEFRYETAEIN